MKLNAIEKSKFTSTNFGLLIYRAKILVASYKKNPNNALFFSSKNILSLLSRITLALMAIFFIGLIFAFIIFHYEVTSLTNVKSPTKSDGIVVFTGGEDRLKTAFKIYEAGNASRMLISGVHKDTSMAAIKNAVGSNIPNICCIDLDRKALHTHGNAVETAKWVKVHNLKSLIVVTSDYHLPRSLLELGNKLPSVKLVPIAPLKKPVLDNVVKQKAIKLYLKEFVKYLAAFVKLRLF